MARKLGASAKPVREKEEEMTDSYVVRNLHASSLSGRSKEEEIQRQAVLEERAAHRRTARHCKLLVTAKHLEDEAP